MVVVGVARSGVGSRDWRWRGLDQAWRSSVPSAIFTTSASAAYAKTRCTALDRKRDLYALIS